MPGPVDEYLALKFLKKKEALNLNKKALNLNNLTYSLISIQQM